MIVAPAGLESRRRDGLGVMFGEEGVVTFWATAASSGMPGPDGGEENDDRRGAVDASPVVSAGLSATRQHTAVCRRRGGQ